MEKLTAAAFASPQQQINPMRKIKRSLLLPMVIAIITAGNKGLVYIFSTLLSIAYSSSTTEKTTIAGMAATTRSTRLAITVTIPLMRSVGTARFNPLSADTTPAHVPDVIKKVKRSLRLSHTLRRDMISSHPIFFTILSKNETMNVANAKTTTTGIAAITKLTSDGNMAAMLSMIGPIDALSPAIQITQSAELCSAKSRR
jgi:hypothetical protein